MMTPSITDESVSMSFLRRLSFALWYFRRPPWDSGITPPELLDFIRDVKPGRAIDLGCGTGTNAITLTRLGWQVTGVDFVPEAIRQAHAKLKRLQVKADLRLGDVTRLDGISGPFDFALDIGCFHSLGEKERSAYLNQLKRVLAPGGIWFMYAFVRGAEANADAGISAGDLARIQESFRLVRRIDGVDPSGGSSAYFIFENLIGRKNQ